ncbi:MAG: hypothetical protein NUV65_04250 [Candidatus Roizmanbacteria bacterium]|nr:hypothetical protein [Candidatus Roizmanbacteria bacterium]
MRHIQHYSNLITKAIRANWLLIVIFALFITNTLYVSYPDEFVNIFGGVFINQGKIPYSQFFDHHLPLAWYLAALMLRISMGSFVLFRVWWGILLFVVLFVLSRIIRRENSSMYPYYMAFFFLYPCIAVYFWLHLYLADSLAALWFSVVFWLLISQTYKPFINNKIIIISSIATSLLVFSSLTYVYVALVLYAWQIYLLNRNKVQVLETLRFSLISSVPYVLFLLFLVVTGSWKDFYISNVVYNTEHYISIPNYTRGRFFNPIKFALTLLYNFHQHYIPLLTQIKDFDLYTPIATTVGWGSFLLLAVLATEHPAAAVLFFLVLSFSSPRSEIRQLDETNYQAGLFIILGFSASFIALWRVNALKLVHAAKDAFRVAQIILVFFLLFSALFLVKNTYEKWYLRYTQKMPGIYDLSYTADFLAKVLPQNDYYWVGPYEPNEEFFVKNGRLPGKYITLLPQFRESEYFTRTFIEQFKTHPPTIVIFKHMASIFGTPSEQFGAFFLQWLDKRYVRLNDLSIVGINSPSTFDINSDLYIRKDKSKEVLLLLKENGYSKQK